MPTDEPIKSIYLKIFEHNKNDPKTAYVKAAQITFGNKADSIRFLKEITQQLVNTREEMVLCLGNEAVKEISELKLKVRKIRKVKELTILQLKKLTHK